MKEFRLTGVPYVGKVSSVGMNKVVLGRPFDKLWFRDNHIYWDRDQDLEMSACSSSKRSVFIFSLHNVKVHTMNPWGCSKFYASCQK